MEPLRLLVVVVALVLTSPSAVVADAGTPSPAPSPSPSASTEPAQPQTFYESIQVRAAEVEVVVLDRAGKRITGLSREDFALFEDGERVEINSFAAAELSTPLPPIAEGPASIVPSAPSPEAAGEPSTEEAPGGLLLAILVDGQGLTMPARNRMLPAVQRFVSEGLRTGDRVMVAERHRGSPVNILLAPSTDPAAMSKALEEASKRATGGTSALAQANLLINDIERSVSPLDTPSLSPAERAYREAETRRTAEDIRSYAEQSHQQTLATLASIEQLVEALAGLPGRKAVLLVGAGISLRPARGFYDAWRNRVADADEKTFDVSSRLDDEEPDTTAALRRVATLANGNRVTLYAWGTAEMMSSVNAGLSNPDAWTTQESSTAALDVRESLQKLVAPTGGSASTDSRDPGRLLGEMRSDFDSYYSLGYTPRALPAGKAHSLRIDVLRPGLSVRHRESRRERTSREMMVERTRAALMLGWQENPLAATVELVPTGAAGKKGVIQLQLTVSLPMSRLVLLPQGEFHEGRLTVYLAARDEGGGASDVSEIVVPIRVPNDQLISALSQRAAYRTRFAVRLLRQHIAVSVRDELGNTAATVVVEHQPTEAETGTVAKARDGSR